MSDWVILVLVLAGIVGVIVMSISIPLYYAQRNQARENHAQLPAFQLESARSIREGRLESRRSHEDTKAFLKSMGIRLEQVFGRVDER